MAFIQYTNHVYSVHNTPTQVLMYTNQLFLAPPLTTCHHLSLHPLESNDAIQCLDSKGRKHW